jgi:hypothetical protein
MLVMMTDNQIISPHTVCQNCVLADHNGQPRWRQGSLGCGRLLTGGLDHGQPAQFECQMGFRVASID